MARCFSIDEQEDLDLTLLVEDFLQRKPEYLPVATAEGTLLLMPYNDYDCGSDGNPDEAFADIIADMDIKPLRGSLLM